MIETHSKVFLIDDDASVREGLRFLIESAAHEVIAFDSALAFLNQYTPDRPGCLVTDVKMPEMSGLELLSRIHQITEALPTIVITGHGDVPMCVRAFENGAFGFIEKPIDHQLLLETIDRAMLHDQQCRAKRMNSVEFQRRQTLLTDREHEVMGLMLEGRSIKGIASKFNISVKTAAKHRARVLDKFGLDNDVELVHLANGTAPDVAAERSS
jgi:FixJ family two-component response regulator